MEISKFITHFKKKIDEHDSLELTTSGGLKPHFPQVVIFWGEDACKGYESISQRLFQLWPQYEKEILFFFVKDTTPESQYAQLTTQDKTVITTQKSLEALQALVISLFGENHYFGDLHNLLIYHVLDTTSFTGVETFDQWICAIERLKQHLDMGGAPILDTFFVLLNENLPVRQQIATDIKNKLANGVSERVSTTMLLSNRRSDAVITGNWDNQYRMITNMMTLTNHRDLALLKSVSHHGVYTVSYAREDKPVAKIGQVIVQKMLEKLSTINFTDCGDLRGDSTLPTRLGLTEGGTIGVLDQYVEETLSKLLPTPTQLTLFPRHSPMDLERPEQCSAKEFNQITMQAWACYLENIVKDVEVRVNHAETLRSGWRERYALSLAEQLKVSELIWLANHPEFVQDKLGATKVAQDTEQVLTAAKLQLKCLISSKFNGIFEQEVLAAGKRAKTFLQDWNDLLQSGRMLHGVSDESLCGYYCDMVTGYMDVHHGEMARKIKTIQTREDMERYLKDMVNGIIDANPIVLAPFEVELNARLGDGMDGGGAQASILEKLSNDQVPIYARTSFALGAPMYSLVMLKTGTGLHNTLHTHLSPTTKYYNTGLGNAAEAINIYELTNNHLLGG